MLSLQRILPSFEQMAKLTSDDATPYHELVSLCIEEVVAKLRPDVDVSLHERLLSQLVAASAYYRYVIMNNMVSGNVSALDLSVTIDNSKQIWAAKQLRDEFALLAKDLLVDDTFLFETIQ